MKANNDMQNQMVMMKDSMNSMMVKGIQKHHALMYTFDILVLIGITTIVVLLFKLLRRLRKK